MIKCQACEGDAHYDNVRTGCNIAVLTLLQSCFDLGKALCICLRDTSSFTNGFLQFPFYAWVPGVPLHALQTHG